MNKNFLCTVLTLVVSACFLSAAGTPPDLLTGRAGHAFDHLGNIGEQADAAAASGASIIYASGLGALGYEGLPPEEVFREKRKAVSDYNAHARSKGIKLIIGYVCATSIVKLDSFNKNWAETFRAQFKTPVAEWRQIGRDGNPLPSWYGGDYQPACMNNPDWRSYEKFMVRQQLESGHDGIFFDNPTVHPQGCYCRHCMGKFAGWLGDHGIEVMDVSLAATRMLADKYPREFMRFRCEIARGFLTDMRAFARSIKRDALITCNNSLNSPDALFSQCRAYGYSIFEFSKVEDFIVVEDMRSQPRLLGDGSAMEYGPTYELLQGIRHGKPVVAVTIADGDYHTPPNLVRLAMAEAAAHGSSYLSWPTWPEKERERMATRIRPQVDFLRQHERILNGTETRADVLLFLPFRRYAEMEKCVTAEIAAALTRSNIQYKVVSEEDFSSELNREILESRIITGRTAGEAKGKIAARLSLPVFLIESLSALTSEERALVTEFEAHGGPVVTVDGGDWQKKLTDACLPSLNIKAPSTVRASVRDMTDRTVVHLYNLGVERISSFEDKVHPVTNIELRIRISSPRINSVRAWSADGNGTVGALKFTSERGKSGTWIKTTIPKLEVSTILTIDF